MASRVILTAPMSAVSVLSFCLLGPVLMVVYVADIYWTCVPGPESLAQIDRGPDRWWFPSLALVGFLTSGPYGLFLAVVVAFAVLSQSNS